MKILPFLFFFLLPAFSYGLRYVAPTPVLHSVLDSPQKVKVSNDDEGWYRRMSAEPKKDDVRLIRYRATRDDWRDRGITMTIIGIVIDVIAGAFFLYWKADDREQRTNGGRSYAGTYVLMSAAALTVGLGLTAAGLSLWLSHL